MLQYNNNITYGRTNIQNCLSGQGNNNQDNIIVTY